MEQADALFDRFDTDGNGSIDFREFVQAVLQPDYPGKSHWQRRCVQSWEHGLARKKPVPPVLSPRRVPPGAARAGPARLPAPLTPRAEFPRPDVEQLRRQISAKFTAFARHSNQQFRSASRVLEMSASKDMTEAEFARRVRRHLMLPATDEQIRLLFNSLDRRGVGRVSFADFSAGVSEPDHTGTGYWDARTRDTYLQATGQSHSWAGIPERELEVQKRAIESMPR